MADSKTSVATIEQLRKRYDSLRKEQITADANYKTAKTQLDGLKSTAQAEYGTADLAELRQKLAEMEAENLRKLTEYQEHLEKMEADLKEVNQKFEQPRGQK
jgi:phage shock protein A